jgi:DNA helicase HerA-like ATPase
MMKFADNIQLADGIIIPKSFVTDVNFFVGIRKYGKSYAVGVTEEEYVEANWPFMVVDPMGIHFALRERYNNVVIVGGKHADYDWDMVKEVIDSNANVVLDVSDENIDDQREIITVVLDYIRERSKELRQPLQLMIEESDIFIPQSGGDSACKEVITWLTRKGRQNGIGVTFINQRFTSIAKEVLTQVDNYMIFKMDSPADEATLKKVIGKDATAEVKYLEQGECYMKSSYYLGLMKFRKRKATHQGFTPELGVKNKIIKLKPLSKRIINKIGLQTKPSERPKITLTGSFSTDVMTVLLSAMTVGIITYFFF